MLMTLTLNGLKTIMKDLNMNKNNNKDKVKHMLFVPKKKARKIKKM